MNNITLELIIDYVVYPEFEGILYYIRAVFLTVSAILFFAILFLLPKISWFRYRYSENLKEFFTQGPLEGGDVSKRWADVMRKFDKGTEGDYKTSIIEADNILLDVLEKIGIEGDSFSEKLNQVNSEKLKNIDDVWLAHKTRNNIVYDPDYKIESEEAKRTIDIYRTAFQNLDVF